LNEASFWRREKYLTKISQGIRWKTGRALGTCRKKKKKTHRWITICVVLIYLVRVRVCVLGSLVRGKKIYRGGGGQWRGGRNFKKIPQEEKRVYFPGWGRIREVGYRLLSVTHPRGGGRGSPRRIREKGEW